MPERPLLKLPNPQPIDPPRKPGGGPRIVRPDRGRQGERMAPRFERHQGYRMAALDVSPGNSEDRYWVTSQRVPCQPTDKTVARGTVFHEQRRGEEAAVFVDDGRGFSPRCGPESRRAPKTRVQLAEALRNAVAGCDR